MTIEFADYEKLILKIIQSSRRRCPYHTIRDTDEYSECCLAFTRCAQQFKPELGFKFSTFLYHACLNAIKITGKRYMKLIGRGHKNVATASVPFGLGSSGAFVYDVAAREAHPAVEIVAHILETATPQDRQALIGMLEGRSLIEMGKLDGVSHETARNKRLKARKYARQAAEAVL